jgi:hypothetical protein
MENNRVNGQKVCGHFLTSFIVVPLAGLPERILYETFALLISSSYLTMPTIFYEKYE